MAKTKEKIEVKAQAALADKAGIIVLFDEPTTESIARIALDKASKAVQEYHLRKPPYGSAEYSAWIAEGDGLFDTLEKARNAHDVAYAAETGLSAELTESTESTDSTALAVQSAGETALANLSQDAVYALADNVPAVKDEGKAIAVSFKNRIRCAEVLAVGYAVRHYQMHRDSRPLAQIITRIKTLSAPVKNALRHILPGATIVKNGVSFAVLFDLESEHVETLTLPDGKEIKRPAIYMAGFNQLMYAARMIAATPSDQWKYIDPVSDQWKKTFPLEKKHETMDESAWRASIEKALIKAGVEPSQAKAQAMNAKRVVKS